MREMEPKRQEVNGELPRAHMSVTQDIMNGQVIATIYTIKLAADANPGRHEVIAGLEQAEQSVGVIDIKYGYRGVNTMTLGVSECPGLPQGESGQWEIQMHPSGQSRRRTSPDTRIVVESDALRYTAAKLSRKRSSRDRKHARRLGETRRDRFYGFYKG